MATATSTDLDERLRAWFADEPQAIRHSGEMWRALRDVGPVYRYGGSTIVLTHELARLVLGDPATFSSVHDLSGSRARSALAELETDAQRDALRGILSFESFVMNRTDGEPHRRVRTAVAMPLRGPQVEELRTLVATHANATFGELGDREEFDLVALCYELPVRVMCDLLAVPPADRDKLHDLTVALGAHRHGMNQDSIVGTYGAWVELSEYFGWHLEHRCPAVGQPHELLRILEARYHADGCRAEAPTALAVSLLGGQDTTSRLLSIGVNELLEARDQWSALVDERSLIPNAVEELARFVSPSQAPGRQVTTQTEIAGFELSPADTVLAGLASANRDPSVFDKPDDLDVTRANAKRHLTFGFGPHFCIGIWLARMEVAAALAVLVERYPALELREPAQFVGPSNFPRLKTLPVASGSA